MVKFSITIACLLISASAFCADSASAFFDGCTEFDFRDYHANESREIVFLLKNPTTRVLKIIAVRSGCDCVDTSAKKTELQPNEKTEINVKIKADSIYEKFDKTIYIQTDDPSNPVLSVNVSGNPIPILRVDNPLEVYAGRLSSNSDWRKEFKLTPTQSDVKLGTVKTESNIPVKTELKRNSDNIFILSVEILPEKDKSGEFTAKVFIPIESPANWKPVTLTISGKYGVELSAVPSKIIITADSKFPVERTLKLKIAGASSEPKLSKEDFSYSAPEGIKIDFKVISADSMEAKVSIPENTLFELAKAKPQAVKISCRNIGKITIPVVIRKQE